MFKFILGKSQFPPSWALWLLYLAPRYDSYTTTTGYWRWMGFRIGVEGARVGDTLMMAMRRKWVK